MTRTATVSDVCRMIEEWAPPAVSWERDNTGLQIGSSATVVRSVLVCLDVTLQILTEARRRGANLVISHHPLLFQPARRIVSGDRVSDILRAAIKADIDIYSAHTNFDFSTGGVSAVLAERLGLTGIDFLSRSYRTKRKIITFVPPPAVDRVAGAMAQAGAGRIGNYEHCSFRSEGTGTFRGNAASSPRVGQRGKLEQSEELRLEMIADEWNVPAVVNAMISAHAYEEAAYDVVPLDNISPEYGMGAIGSLDRSVSPREFLRRVRKKLGTAGLRYAAGTGKSIRRVAVCGGSGSDLLGQALGERADAFVTADIRYHTFQEAEGRILLVDAGHYETEIPAMRALAGKIRRELKARSLKIPVTVSRVSTNPVMFV